MQTCTRCKIARHWSFFTNGERITKLCTGCRENCRARFKRAYRKDPAAKREQVKRYRRENPARLRGRRNADKVARRARQLQAMPKWADQKAIKAVYALAARLRGEGQDVHVEHHYALRGDMVCGLHVPDNLRIVSAPYNLKKGNKPPRRAT